MHKLLAHQLRAATRPDGQVDVAALVSLVNRTYDEFDRERRLTDRGNTLMEEELKDANAQVARLAERRLTDTLESMPCPVAILSPARCIQSVNTAMTALCFRAPAPDMPFAEFLARLTPDAQAGRDLEGVLAGEAAEFSIAGRWYLAAAHRLSDGGYAVTFSDVSMLKEREAVLALAKEAAESANQLKSRFLATMSHELRTPLNAILGFSEMIWSHVLGNNEKAWVRYAEYARSIHESGDHLRALISGVLDLSKIEAGAYTLDVEAIAIAKLVEESLTLVRPQAERGLVRLLAPRLEKDGAFDGDCRALRQVLVNLLSNAVKFTPEGGEVEVTCRPDGEAVLFQVRDTGVGIAEEHRLSVFEPFHQGDTRVARRFEGTGLGLSIVRGIVEMHGGKVWLESEPDAGTSFFVRLPRVQARVEGVPCRQSA